MKTIQDCDNCLHSQKNYTEYPCDECENTDASGCDPLRWEPQAATTNEKEK